ncbi:SMC-Scp complex subunit ScpB [Enteractinococcus coprophilus]|uniref:Segregation and condensation protein B n=1 Tax=Enteractinococcus coprophilus TaxID=1027633 RepID=A0A543AJX7_9MICC|nr:SMC-Scp complex subunit ScpB [Enteractinococcus coprophilus]TQL72872.1 segregation and condensation protein B [Enteractinococcus coprophilus]
MTQQRYQSELFAQLEAILLISDEPVTIQQLVTATAADPTELQTTLEAIQRDYDGEVDGKVRGFQLRHVAGGWRLYTRAEHADVIATFMVQGATQKLSQAGLETLAVIAYLQPATRSRVAQIRGVNSDSVVRTLLTRGLIAEGGVEEITGAVRYRTTDYFLELLGLNSIEELPKISPLLPGVAEASQLAESQE